MADILDLFPEYVLTGKLDELRAREYGYLDEQGHTYVDYTGAGLPARRQYHAHKARLEGATFGNPHSMNPTSHSATVLVEKTRERVLSYLNASPDEYQVIFTPNATGAAKLVGEAYSFRKSSRLVLTSDNHNSVVGLREFAGRAGAHTNYVPIQQPSLRIATSAVTKALPRRKRFSLGKVSPGRRGLFAYPAQSNFSGVRHPLGWVSLAQERGYDVLLDAAAYLPTCALDLSTVQPDFVIISWYKVFGFPTGVGCLVARHDAMARLKRPYFAGGTVEAATIGVPWHKLSTGPSAYEDGTSNFLSIPDVHVGLDWLSGIGMELIGTRVRCLTGYFLARLSSLEHTNGAPMARIYGPTDLESRGGTVTFNFLDNTGKVVDERLVATESAAAGISLRTGCFCNPGAGEAAFSLSKKRISSIVRAKPTTFAEVWDLSGLPTGGAIRVSFGISSTARDVEYIIAFATKTYLDRTTNTEGLPERTAC
ncbi:Molybdenum cofactor sulfurtransferase [Purpureocillium takamizusanense]|uniref:Molybdenum cofactor sulfurtransferase n=1 Tax=Purpureocillium takamizusanense TaxID=2060973 RepID=A0A9Q8QR70_9HYPO|nr:Molybdenum cofactor sulfurtransferase [Purpureocillium takamizusanense]UNI23816.1 Molybdenum cofactor sulfurtransferase [Purpureocillium takamizusanense]